MNILKTAELQFLNKSWFLLSCPRRLESYGEQFDWSTCATAWLLLAALPISAAVKL